MPHAPVEREAEGYEIREAKQREAKTEREREKERETFLVLQITILVVPFNIRSCKPQTKHVNYPEDALSFPNNYVHMALLRRSDPAKAVTRGNTNNDDSTRISSKSNSLVYDPQTASNHVEYS